jgi:hypothetical protein
VIEGMLTQAIYKGDHNGGRKETEIKKPAKREHYGQKQLQGGVYIQQLQVKLKAKNMVCVFSNES